MRRDEPLGMTAKEAPGRHEKPMNPKEHPRPQPRSPNQGLSERNRRLETHAVKVLGISPCQPAPRDRCQIAKTKKW